MKCRSSSRMSFRGGDDRIVELLERRSTASHCGFAGRAQGLATPRPGRFCFFATWTRWPRCGGPGGRNRIERLVFALRSTSRKVRTGDLEDREPSRPRRRTSPAP